MIAGVLRPGNVTNGPTFQQGMKRQADMSLLLKAAQFAISSSLLEEEGEEEAFPVQTKAQRGEGRRTFQREQQVLGLPSLTKKSFLFIQHPLSPATHSFSVLLTKPKLFECAFYINDFLKVPFRS